jgi:hypothetical protein
MAAEGSTVRELIERAASTSNASQTFIDSVIELFNSKGISLDAPGEGYADMIALAFASHGARREAFRQIKQELQDLNVMLAKLPRAWMELAEKTRKLEEALQQRQRQLATTPPPVPATRKPEPKPEERKSALMALLQPKLLLN